MKKLFAALLILLLLGGGIGVTTLADSDQLDLGQIMAGSGGINEYDGAG